MNETSVVIQAKKGYGSFFMNYFEKAAFYISILLNKEGVVYGSM